ncbi:hypothetical protein HW555_011466 [Spodoptera exigua]|uniref:(+)RNA virus helicase C-terminal domain-containing protein n=1 Tax=Spodoptera exigua TaxID=7107 RepID=A0A835G574_SPOEX|nr:hypothetical protein HW555_011466 [Spodoptera exigua]
MRSDSECEYSTTSISTGQKAKSCRKPSAESNGKRKIQSHTTSARASKKTNTDSDIFGISKNRNIPNKEHSLDHLTSFIVNRVASGCERRATTTDGEFYIDCKVYKTEDARLTDSAELWKKALIRMKFQTDVDSLQWRKLQELVTKLDITTCGLWDPDLREKLAHRLGQRTRTRVRTMASILSNGFRAHDKCHRIIVDEALMNHFGAIVMAARLSGASEVVLVGDVNQLPFLDRENLFQLNYTRPNVVAAITHELSCTHRNPMDVAYTLGEIYPGIYSSRTTQSRVHSLRVERYTGAKIPRLAQNTLGEGSRLLTIHEAQGLTSDNVLVINTKTRRLQIHESVSHAVVAVSRHRVSCVYYTDDANDAAGRLIKRAMEANTKMVVDYNLKMAMKHRDAPIIEEMLHLVKSLVGKGHPPQN